MNVLNRLTLRNLKLNKKRTIVTIIGIILSGAMICGVATLIASFQDLLIQSAIRSGGNYHVTFFDVPYGESKYLLENGQAEITMMSRDHGFAPLDNPQNTNRPYLLVKQYDQTAFSHMPVTLKEGRIPKKSNEIVVSEQLTSGKDKAFYIGQTITLTLGKRVANDRVLTYNDRYVDNEIFEPVTAKTYTITGIIAKPQYESTFVPAYTALSLLEEDNLAISDGVNISMLMRHPRRIYRVVPEMAESLDNIGYRYNNELLRWMGISQNNNYNDLMMSLGLIIILLIVIGSVTVIYNAFAISVSERKKQFGMLSSVGATAGQIRKTVFFEGLILGIIGIPIGIVSGIFGIGVTMKIINPLIMTSMVRDSELELRLIVSPMTILVTIFFVALVILLSAFIPAKRASKISPIEAIRLNTDIQIKGKRLRTLKLTRVIFGIEGELALKNLKRNRRRYRATVFSLFISIVLFVSFSTFVTYGFESSDMHYQDIPYNLTVHKYDVPIDKLKEFYHQIAQIELVERYVMPRNTRGQVHIQSEDLDKFMPYIQKNYIDQGIVPEDANINSIPIGFSILSLGEKEFLSYLNENGLNQSAFSDGESLRAILVNKAMFVGDKYVEYVPTKLIKGDKITLEEISYGGNVSNVPAKYTLELAAITETLPFGIQNNNILYLIVSEDVFEAIRDKLNEDNQRMVDRMEMRIMTGVPVALSAEINAIHDQNYFGSVYVRDIAAIQEDVKRTKMVISIFLYGFVTLITLIGITNIFNTISTNVALRRREFAMLKSVGLTPRSFNKMIHYESIFYGLKALFYGLPISILISIWMYNSFGRMFSFQFMLPWKAINICIIAVFLIVFMTMMHASGKLKKDNIVDTLKEENL